MSDNEESSRRRFLLSTTRTSRPLTLKIEDIDFKDLPNEKDYIFGTDSPPIAPPVSACAYNGQFQVVGSCNGLLCLVRREEYHYILWNPGTGECRDDFAATPHPYLNNICHRFGHDSSRDDYKILRVAFAIDMQIWILNVRSNLWRVFELEEQNLSRILFSGDATLAYKSLHWIASRRNDLAMENRENNKILSFSLVEDKFEKIIPLPKLNAHYRVSQLRAVGGKLSVLAVNSSIQNGTYNIDVQVMKEDHVKDSWEKKVTLSFDQMPQSVL